MQDITNTQSLIAWINSGNTPKYLHFWGHTPASPLKVDKSCLSQWFPAQFEIDGNTYFTAEHYMMAEKARLFGDYSVAEKILVASTPGEAKSLGRSVANYDEARWAAARFGIVVKGNYAKFAQNESLGAFLLTTQNRILVEASPVDAIWGNGLAADDPDASSPSNWPGLNLLGFALMQARRLL